MGNSISISNDFIDAHTDYPTLIEALQAAFATQSILVPQRHHHDFPNTLSGVDSTLLLMPAWQDGKEAGVKIVTVSPDNHRYDLPAVQATYILLDVKTGQTKAIIEANSLTAHRTAAASALASSFLSNPASSSMLMIGTGALASRLINAHASVRPIENVYIWGRSYAKAQTVGQQLRGQPFTCHPIKNLEDQIGKVDIVSCATLSPDPLVLGEYLQPGQHIDLVGAYKPNMRESDDEVMKKASIFVDTFGGSQESGDIYVPLERRIIQPEDIKGDLFSLCSGKSQGRTQEQEITLFKSVGHALEDLVGASYYFRKYQYE